jgi:short subunit dehydrogenase-like uncharacterized protein
MIGGSTENEVAHDGVLIYGATGLTGQLVVRAALARGIRPMLAGRSQGKLASVARVAGLEHYCAALDDPTQIRRMLQDIAVVLNVAGPFRSTATPLVRACVEARAHYLDLSGEYASIDSLASQSKSAATSGVMLMPGVGFDIVATDCAAALAARQLPGATHLSLALTGLDAISPGSANSVLEQSADMVMVRRNGELIRIPPGELVGEFDFGRGPKRAAAVTWGDVASAGYTTGISNVTVYYEETPAVRLGLLGSRYRQYLPRTPLVEAWQRMAVDLLAKGPSAAQRAAGRAVVVARASDASGAHAEVRIETPEVYTFTAATAAAIVDRVVAGDFCPGFQTPARAYGAEYVTGLPGVSFTRIC